MKQLKIIVVIAFVLVFFFNGPAAGHRVNVFAWAEGETVNVTGKFAGGGKISEGTVRVYGREDNLLLEGKTDDQGEFSFPVPEISDLKIEVSAGPGHRGEWLLSAKEIRLAAGIGPDMNQNVTGRKKDPLDKQKPGPVENTVDDEKYSAGQIETIVNQAVKRAVDDALEEKLNLALETKLAPVMRNLSEMKNPGPTVSDIFGGIGYILGLFGIAAYIYSRRH